MSLLLLTIAVITPWKQTHTIQTAATI